MAFEQVLQYILSGVTNGSIYAIVAIGFNIVYNTTGIINFAQGEFLMLGGMTAISLSQFMPLPLAILFAVIITSLAGAMIDFVFIRRLRNPSVLMMIIVTIGLSIVIREMALHIWDEKVRSLPYFTGSEVTSISILGAYISPQVLWVLGVCGLMVLLLGLFFRYTATGRSMRACSSNKTAAGLCGINTGNMVTISFMLSAAMGALAGCVISPITQTQYDSGTSLAIKGFTVAILGGMGNSTGAVVGGLLIGMLESFSISVLPMAYKDAISLAILILILFIRPSGLFGSREESALKEF
ncbi:MAG: branched-chain amino acid ABC transporter permease [Spirochaetes bacterium]|jgi:branched-chain amino acid transport system permease protein|nr:branched-chain amino acid ABC transporter permease [Spirochaetota bacterium]